MNCSQEIRFALIWTVDIHGPPAIRPFWSNRFPANIAQGRSHLEPQRCAVHLHTVQPVGQVGQLCGLPDIAIVRSAVA